MTKNEICRVWFETISCVEHSLELLYNEAHNKYVDANQEFNSDGGFIGCYDLDVAPLREQALALKYAMQLLNEPEKIMEQALKRK